MSEYQYYEFQAVDRPLNKRDIAALRALSTRARITATSFTNHYNWGDFKGDPTRLMKRWFDLHLYFANWMSRRLMIRLPKRLINRDRLDTFLRDVDCVEIRTAGENVIIDIWHDYEPSEFTDDDDGSGWLGALAPLRADLLAGDWRMFYLLWLMAAQTGTLEDGEKEPLAGIGPLNVGLETFADFFHIDRDLVQAAAEESPYTSGDPFPTDSTRTATISAIPDEEKTALLERLAAGDPHVMAEVRSRIQEALAPTTTEIQDRCRTISTLRARAAEICKERKADEAAQVEAKRQQREREAEKARRARLNILRLRGLAIWDEVENEIEKRNINGYERATDLLADLRVLAEEDNTSDAYSERLRALRSRHSRKVRFIEQLTKL